MRRAHVFLIAAGMALLAGSCKKDSVEEEGTSDAAYISFRADSGYTYRSDTVGVSDTLHIGVQLTEGDDDLRTLYIEVSYNGAPAVRKDSIHVAGNGFEHFFWPIMDSTPGTEKWTFRAVEYDWDETKRSLTFVRQ
jgi:hypothetical protein